jgi:DNA-binding MurR/RpiR family transcriptional regulator
MILAKIKKMLPEMQPGFRKVGSYILDHEQTIAFSSIYTISSAIGVSNATLVRFSKNLGLGGYQELKREIQEEMRHRLSPFEKIAMQELDSLPDEKRLQKLFQNEINNLRNTFDIMRIQDIHTIVMRICEADKLFACGFGATQHLVRAFEYALTGSLNKEMSVVTGSVSDYAPVLKFFSKKDVMFLMTFPPYSREVLHVAKVVKDRGGTLFLFTDSASCPVFHLADTVIRCDTNSLLLSNSYVGLVSTLNILIHMVFLSSKDRSIETRSETIDLQEDGYAILYENQ